MKIRYWPNSTIKYKKFSLDVTRTGTVYWNSDRGKRKLDTCWFAKTQSLAVVLPNNEGIHIKSGKDGLFIVENEENPHTGKKVK